MYTILIYFIFFFNDTATTEIYTRSLVAASDVYKRQVLYWHWSPDKGWAINLPIRGWNESLITYVMAASSTTHGIPASVYTNGWKTGSNFNNGNSYYGIQLPLGPALGGPLFFEHYTFMGINPNGLVEGGINYLTQAKNHTLINYNYCKANPKAWYGSVSYTHLRAHETVLDIVCRLLLEKKKSTSYKSNYH